MRLLMSSDPHVKLSMKLILLLVAVFLISCQSTDGQTAETRAVKKSPKFTQVGLDVKEPFVRLNLRSRSGVKGHSMLILQPWSEA